MNYPADLWQRVVLDGNSSTLLAEGQRRPLSPIVIPNANRQIFPRKIPRKIKNSTNFILYDFSTNFFLRKRVERMERLLFVVGRNRFDRLIGRKQKGFYGSFIRNSERICCNGMRVAGRSCSAITMRSRKKKGSIDRSAWSESRSREGIRLLRSSLRIMLGKMLERRWWDSMKEFDAQVSITVTKKRRRKINQDFILIV